MASLAALPPGSLAKVLGERTLLHDRIVGIKNKKMEVEDAVYLQTDHQLLLVSLKGKLVHEFHLLDVKKIESKTSEELTLTVDKKDPLTLRTKHCDEIIAHIRVGFARDFPTASEEYAIQLAVVPPTRLSSVTTFFPEFDFERVPMGPCGGFSRTYASLCTYHGLPVRDDIVWDMDNIVFANAVKEFNFAELDDIDNSKDILPILGALDVNRWFTSLIIRDTKLLPEGLAALSTVMRINSSIEKLEVSNVGATEKFFLSLGESLSKNANSALAHLNLSDNPIKDEGFVNIATAIQGFKAGLVSINVSNTGLGKKAATALGNALRKNVNYTQTLTVLDVSNNNLGPEGVASLADFLAQPNNVKRLLLGNTGPNVEALFAPLARGCTQALTHLDLSNNKFAKKPTVSQASFEQFFSSVLSLKHVDFSGSKLTPAYLDALLARLVGNAVISDVVLNLQDNDFVPQQAAIFQKHFSKSTNIVELDISDNDQLGDEGILQLLKGLKNSTVEHLRIERMFKTRSKFREHAIAELASLLSSERVKITMLSLANCGLKGDIIDVLDTIGTNENLVKLDISGNQMGDKGAFVLSKALQKNQKLRKLVWDNNSTTIVGFTAFGIALSRNRTLQQMPFPMSDLLASMKLSEARTRAFMSRAEELLQANQRPERLDGTGAVDKSQGQLTSSQQESLDRLALQVKRLHSNLSDEQKKTPEAEQLQEETTNLVADVESNRQLSVSLSSTMEGLQSVQDSKLAESLEGLATQLDQVLESQFQRAVNEAVDIVKNTIKHMDDPKVAAKLNTFLQVGAQKLDRAYLQKVLVQQVAKELAFSRATSLASVASIANNFAFERLSEHLEDLLERLQNLLKTEPVSAVLAVQPADASTPAATAPAPAAIIAAEPIAAAPSPVDEAAEAPAPLALRNAIALKKKMNRNSRRIDVSEFVASKPPSEAPVSSSAPATSSGLSHVSTPTSATATSDEAAVLSFDAAPASAAPASTLTHMTKSRPAQAKKRLPTRQARPARAETDALDINADDDDSSSANAASLSSSAATAPATVVAKAPSPTPPVLRPRTGSLAGKPSVPSPSPATAVEGVPAAGSDAPLTPPRPRGSIGSVPASTAATLAAVDAHVVEPQPDAAAAAAAESTTEAPKIAPKVAPKVQPKAPIGTPLTPPATSPVPARRPQPQIPGASEPVAAPKPVGRPLPDKPAPQVPEELTPAASEESLAAETAQHQEDTSSPAVLSPAPKRRPLPSVPVESAEPAAPAPPTAAKPRRPLPSTPPQ